MNVRIPSSKRLVLNFDLNRTILMSDAVGGRSVEDTVNYLLSECAYGKVDLLSGKWTLVSEHPSLSPPKIEGTHSELASVSYKSYIDSLFPYDSMSESNVSIRDVRGENRKMKKMRTQLQSSFTHSGQPGAEWKRQHDILLELLHFPCGPEREHARMLAKSMPPSSRLRNHYEAGRFYLLPSFLRFLFYFADLNTIDQTSKHCIMYRTFGDDIPEVSREIQLLVEGRHPLFIGVKLSESMALSPPYGAIYRDGYDANGTALILNTLEKVPPGLGLEFYNGHIGASIHVGFKSIKREIDNILSSKTSFGVRDYWEWWSLHAESAECGKILLVDRNEKAARCDIVFDDHIESHGAHIIDVRDVATGLQVPYSESSKDHLRRVEPYLAITDKDYFIKMTKYLLE